MSDRIRAVAAFVVAGVTMVLALWLFTADIHVDEGPVYAGKSAPEGDSSFCGSAYDVVLLRGDGFMGGETPTNQSRLNELCVRKAGRYVATASVAGTISVMLAGFACAGLLRSTNTVGTHRRQGAVVGASSDERDDGT